MKIIIVSQDSFHGDFFNKFPKSNFFDCNKIRVVEFAGGFEETKKSI